MSWCDVSLVRAISGVSEDQYSTGTIQDFISLAQKEVNSKVCQKVIREKIEYLDSTRKNEINGINTTYYVRNWKGNYFGDRDYDGALGVTDIKVYQVSADGTETVLTPTSMNYENCSFTLSSAPSTVTLYIDYWYTPLNPITPDAFLSQVTAYLAASYLYVGDDSGSIRFGNVSISGSSGGLKNQFYDKYMELMNQLNEDITAGATWGESYVKI